MIMFNSIESDNDSSTKLNLLSRQEPERPPAKADKAADEAHEKLVDCMEGHIDDIFHPLWKTKQSLGPCNKAGKQAAKTEKQADEEKAAKTEKQEVETKAAKTDKEEVEKKAAKTDKKADAAEKAAETKAAKTE